jgi:hypothetical protein
MLIRASVISDVFREAESIYWRRRADQFEDSKPRIDDYHGHATRADLSLAWRRCHELAEACRARAAIAHAAERSTGWRASA